jgi:hypothetical protein
MALPVSRLVRIVIQLTQLSAQRRSFGILMIAGDSNVINGEERYRSYNSIEAVATDFGTSAPEYFAAALYFGQTPKPRTVMIGRWLRTASAAFNEGGTLTPTQQLISTWTAITNGGLVIVVDGVTKTLTGLDFSAQTNLNGVATIIDTALSGATITWDGSRFRVTSGTTGVSSTVSYATTGAGTDLAPLLRLTAATGANLVDGFAAETPVACAAALVNISSAWYGLMFQASTQPTDDQNIDVCGFIEALDLKRIFGVTITNTDVLDSGEDQDLASRMKDGAYRQSFNQYSQNAYAIASFFGRAFSVNFNANRSTITMMYKQEPGVTGEELTDTQANTLQTKRCNVFVNYVNDTVIIQYGVMSGPYWFDEVHGLDWLQDAVQNACYNLMYTSPTKIPQTDAGSNQFVNAINSVYREAGSEEGGNGLIGPGVWNGDEFGVLKTGDYLKTGSYTYVEPMALQSQADRETRTAPPIMSAIKLAGAIQEVDAIIQVNR